MRISIVVCDSLGVGGAPDAARFEDQGADTVGNTARAVGGLRVPNLAALGLGAVGEIEGVPAEPAPGTAHGRMRERSAGKDSTTGHWEIAGLVTDRPFPTYPEGFPPEVIEPFERAIGRKVLGNRPASGTEVLEELGEEHLRTGRPIVYTSADSVFQVAAHQDVVPVETLYHWCRTARSLLDGDHRVGRVIARPFVGTPGAFVRTHDRRDFSVSPPGPTVLDRVAEAGIPVLGIGKIGDLFAGRGLTEWWHSGSDRDGIDRTIGALGGTGDVLVVTNLVDLDTSYGHRNDPTGYARCLEAIDARLPELVRAIGRGALFVTGDHGCDPTDASTDHTREEVPVLVGGLGHRPPVDVGTRETFGDLGATVAEAFGVSTEGLAGESFAGHLGLVG